MDELRFYSIGIGGHMLLDLDLLNDEQLEKDATSASALAIRKAEK